MRRKLVVVLVLIILGSMLVVPVSANGVPPMPYYTITLSELPEGTVYVDMLVKLPEGDSAYTPLVTENLPEGFSEDAQIIGYCEDDYRSYTFHYKNAQSVIDCKQTQTVLFFTDLTQSNINDVHLKNIEKQGSICLAMLDETGNILQVSKKLSLKPNTPFEYVLGTFHYNANENTLDVEGAGAPMGILVYVVIGILGTLLTCVVERVTAWPFGFGKKYSRVIWLTNLVSQVLMRIIYVPLYSMVFREYWYTVFFLELLIYAGEYIFYSLRMKDVSRRRILLYTVLANTISLVFSVIVM